MGITYGNFFFARPNKKVPKRPKRHLENLEKNIIEVAHVFH